MNKISVPDIAIDKTYMIQLVEVQHRRGATGGVIFANTIKNLDPELPLPESPSFSFKLPKAGNIYFHSLPIQENKILQFFTLVT